MARCWTCGKLTSESVWKCPTCRTENAIQTLQQKVVLSNEKLAKVEQHGFEVLSDELYALNQAQQRNIETLSDGFGDLAEVLQDGFGDITDRLREINTTIEWGFGEISWQLQQNTVVLKNIDQTLKTPTQTKANEWRQMAEESRSRGVLDDTEKIFLRSLDVIEGNPLDYRTYIGLARTYIQMNEFSKAKAYFEKSVPHAPDNSYKSYSYRMIGHVDECVGDYHSAVSALKSATEVSPDSYIAFYDLARYSAKIELEEGCLSALNTAIEGDSIYFYIAESADFEPLTNQTKNLLHDIKSETLNRVRSELSELTQLHKTMQERITNEDIQVAILGDVKSKIKDANNKAESDDYKSFLEALCTNVNTYKIADKAQNDIDDTINARNKALASISEAEKAIISAEESIANAKIILKSCIDNNLNSETEQLQDAKSELEKAKNRLPGKNLNAFLAVMEISKRVYELADGAMTSATRASEMYESTHSERISRGIGTFFKVFGISILLAIPGAIAGCWIGCAVGVFSSSLSADDGAGGGMGILPLIIILGGIIFGIKTAYKASHSTHYKF